MKIEKMLALNEKDFREFTALRKKIDSENRLATDEEKVNIKKYMDDINAREIEIKMEKEAEKLESRNADFVFNGKGEKVETREENQAKSAKVIDKWLRLGGHGLTKEERAFINLTTNGSNEALEIRATTGITNPTYATDTELVKSVDAAKQHYAGWFGATTEVKTAKGNTMYWPQFDDSAVTGALEASGTDAIDGGTAITLARLTLEAYIYSSQGLVIGNDSLADWDVPLSQMVYDPLAVRLMKAIATAGTTGTGSSQPDGIVTNAGIGEIAAASTLPTKTDLLNLVKLVDYAYHHGPKSGFMMHSSSMYGYFGLAKGTGDESPVWLPSMRDGAPASIYGFPYWINNEMDEIGADKNPVLFGDFSTHIMRFAGPTQLVRLTERYAEKLQTGFIMLQRFDSDTLQAGTGIKSIRNLGT